MQSLIFYTHMIAVSIFLLIYIVRLTLLLFNSTQNLEAVINATRIPERILAVLFLTTGIIMIQALPEVNVFMVSKLLCVIISIPLAVVAFRKKFKTLAVATLILLISAYGLAQVSTRHLTESPPEQTSMDGKTIYKKTCEKCHRSGNKKGFMTAPDLRKSNMSESIMREVVKNGKGRMPAYKKVLDDTQITLVVAYIKSIKE